jgi:hypothetical protein
LNRKIGFKEFGQSWGYTPFISSQLVSFVHALTYASSLPLACAKYQEFVYPSASAHPYRDRHIRSVGICQSDIRTRPVTTSVGQTESGMYFPSKVYGHSAFWHNTQKEISFMHRSFPFQAQTLCCCTLFIRTIFSLRIRAVELSFKPK